MAKFAVLFLIFIFIQVARLQSKFHYNLISNIDGEKNTDLDRSSSNYNHLPITEDADDDSLIQTTFLKKLSPNSGGISEEDLKKDSVNPELLNLELANEIYHQDDEDNKILKNLKKSELFQRLARKADNVYDHHRKSISGPHKISLLKPALKKVRQQDIDKQNRILEDIKKLNPEELKTIKMLMQRQAPLLETNILETTSQNYDASKTSEDYENIASEPQKDMVGENIKVIVNIEEVDKHKDSLDTTEIPSETIIIEPNSEDETAISTDIKNFKTSSKLDGLEKARNHIPDVIKPVPDSDFSPDSTQCNIYCLRQYYLQYGNNYYCCIQYTPANLQFSSNSHYYQPCHKQCNCCGQNHYVQQYHYVQQNYVPGQQYYVSSQKQFLPPQQHYIAAQHHYVQSQQYYVPSQQQYSPASLNPGPSKQYYTSIQQNPTEGNYYWPYIYDGGARSYKPLYK